MKENVQNVQENLRFCVHRCTFKWFFLETCTRVLDVRCDVALCSWSVPRVRSGATMFISIIDECICEANLAFCHLNSFGSAKPESEVEPIKMDYWMQMLKIIINDYFRIHFVYWSFLHEEFIASRLQLCGCARVRSQWVLGWCASNRIWWICGSAQLKCREKMSFRWWVGRAWTCFKKHFKVFHLLSDCS